MKSAGHKRTNTAVPCLEGPEQQSTEKGGGRGGQCWAGGVSVSVVESGGGRTCECADVAQKQLMWSVCGTLYRSKKHTGISGGAEVRVQTRCWCLLTLMVRGSRGRLRSC